MDVARVSKGSWHYQAVLLLLLMDKPSSRYRIYSKLIPGQGNMELSNWSDLCINSEVSATAAGLIGKALNLAHDVPQQLEPTTIQELLVTCLQTYVFSFICDLVIQSDLYRV